MGEKVIWRQGQNSDEEYPGEFKPAARCITHVVRHDDGSETFYVKRFTKVEDERKGRVIKKNC